MTMTPQAVKSAAAQETDECWLVLLKIQHEALSDAIRVVCNDEPVVSNGETYQGLYFSVDLPSDDDNDGSFTVSLDNVDRIIVDSVNAISTAPTATLSVILASDPDSLLVTFDATAVSFEADALTVSATFRADDLLNEPYPGIRYTPASHSGLF